jgi:hypothetical protein
MIKQSRAARASDSQTLALPTMATDLSAWTAPAWIYNNSTAGQNTRMNWRFALPDGSWSTDVQHSYLLQLFRLLLWLLLNDTSGSSKRYKTGSVAVLSVGIRTLFRWMVHRNLRNFNELTVELSNQFYAQLPAMVVDGPSHFGGASAVEIAAMYHSDIEDADAEDDNDHGTVGR